MTNNKPIWLSIFLLMKLPRELTDLISEYVMDHHCKQVAKVRQLSRFVRGFGSLDIVNDTYFSYIFKNMYGLSFDEIKSLWFLVLYSEYPYRYYNNAVRGYLYIRAMFSKSDLEYVAIHSRFHEIESRSRSLLEIDIDSHPFRETFSRLKSFLLSYTNLKYDEIKINV